MRLRSLDQRCSDLKSTTPGKPKEVGVSSASLSQACSMQFAFRGLLKVVFCNVDFHGDSLDITLCTDEIDDVHIPQFSDDAGSQGEWDPNQATSNRPTAAVSPPFTLSSPITDSIRTAHADTQVRCSHTFTTAALAMITCSCKLRFVAKNNACVSVPEAQV